jgi:glycosyltransferase involved in cell wall biosynthesis
MCTTLDSLFSEKEVVMRYVLFITYQFPPAGGPGVQRSLKFIKYLPAFGWQPIVITAKPAAYAIKDYSLFKDVPENTPIYRVTSFDINALRPVFEKIKLGMLVTLINLLFQVPDPAFVWRLLARSTVKKAVQIHNPELVYSSSGPGSAHLLAKCIKRKYRLPWIADFRDLWFQNRVIPYLPGYRLLNKFMERGVLKHADVVTSVSQPLIDAFQSNCKGNRDKFYLISNGYDPDDFQEILPFKKDGTLTITHIGSFYRHRKVGIFIDAIEKLIGRGKINRDSIQIQFIGRNIPKSIPSKAPFIVQGYLPHKSLCSIREQTDAFLLITDTAETGKGLVSSKLYEYLASNRPILALVAEGGAAQLILEETRTGIMLRGDAEEMALTIEKLFNQIKMNSDFWHPDRDKIRNYSRVVLTEKLVHCFYMLTDERKSR